MSAGRTGTHSWAKRETCNEVGHMVPGETDLVPCLGRKTHFLSHQVVKELYIHGCVGLSLILGPGRAEPVGNPSSPCRRLVWGRLEQDENCL